MGDTNVHPLFFTSNTLAKANGKQLLIREYDVCKAILEVIQRDDLKGVQKVGGLWRIYVHSTESRAALYTKGIDLYNQHVALLTNNPYSFLNKGEERPIKIRIFDVKMHFGNDHIEKHLAGLGVKLIEPVKYENIRDDEKHETEFLSGVRYTYAEAAYLRQSPLPQWMLIGSSIAKVRHYGQSLADEECRKCFAKDHPTFKCSRKQCCRVCKVEDHREGTESCPAYTESSQATIFGGRKNVLSNFYPCHFTYNGYNYSTREQAIQHQKAIYCNSQNVGKRIMMMTDDPGDIKRLSKCVVKNTVWMKSELDVYDEICYEAAKQDETYYNKLIGSDGLLVEAVQDNYKWSCGLSVTAAMKTQSDKFRGQNLMGKVHMRIRDRLHVEQKGDEWKTPPHPARQHTTEQFELTFENKYKELTSGGEKDENVDDTTSSEKEEHADELSSLKDEQDVESSDSDKDENESPESAENPSKRPRGSSSSSLNDTKPQKKKSKKKSPKPEQLHQTKIPAYCKPPDTTEKGDEGIPSSPSTDKTEDNKTAKPYEQITPTKHSTDESQTEKDSNTSNQVIPETTPMQPTSTDALQVQNTCGDEDPNDEW